MSFSSYLEHFFHRFGSKKLLAFAISTALLAFNLITNEQWYIIALTYMGGQLGHDLWINHKYGPGSAQGLNKDDDEEENTEEEPKPEVKEEEKK